MSRWALAKCTVWPLGVVVFPPLLDQDLSLTQTVEDFAIEQFISHSPVEVFAISILPRRTWLDECRLCIDSRDPLPNRLGDELRPVARREDALF